MNSRPSMVFMKIFVNVNPFDFMRFPIIGVASDLVAYC